MKHHIPIIALGILALAGCAELPTLPTPRSTQTPALTSSHSAVLKYRSGVTRSLVVPIPVDVKYKNAYARQYVGGYIGAYNTGVDRSEMYWEAHKEQLSAPLNREMYASERLESIRDLDTVAPDDKPTSGDARTTIEWTNDMERGRNAGETQAEQDLKALAKREHQ